MIIPTNAMNWGFNAGMIRRPYGWLVADRCFDSNKVWSVMLRRFDPTLRELGWWMMADTYGMEDVRLIQGQSEDELLGVGTHVVFNLDGSYQSVGIATLTIVDDIKHAPVVSRLGMVPEFPVDRWQKNWSPFWHDGKLMFTYSIVPHMVLEFRDNGICPRAAISQADDWEWPWGEPRAGAPPIRVGDVYIASFHSSLSRDEENRAHPGTEFKLKRRYYAGFYAFEAKPPFRILSMSRTPLNHWLLNVDDTDQRSGVKVVFPMMNFMEGDNIVIGYGENDLRTRLVVLPWYPIRDDMRPVRTSTRNLGVYRG